MSFSVSLEHKEGGRDGAMCGEKISEDPTQSRGGTTGDKQGDFRHGAFKGINVVATERFLLGAGHSGPRRRASPRC